MTLDQLTCINHGQKICPEDFPSYNYICIVRYQGRPVAPSFLKGYGHTLEEGWNSSLHHYISMRPDMFLYWKILCLPSLVKTTRTAVLLDRSAS